MASAPQKLRRLTNAPATAEHQAEFNKQVSDESSDRGFCLLIVSQLENELDRALEAYLNIGTQELRDQLYGQDGPLGTFGRKIPMAEALGITGPVGRENLRTVRLIRNAFAHAKVPITFETAEVKTVTERLVHINIYDPPRPVGPFAAETPRGLFGSVCAELMLRLTGIAGHPVDLKQDGEHIATCCDPLE